MARATLPVGLYCALISAITRFTACDVSECRTQDPRTALNLLARGSTSLGEGCSGVLG